MLGSSSKPPCSVTTDKINTDSRLPSHVPSPRVLSYCPHSSRGFSRPFLSPLPVFASLHTLALALSQHVLPGCPGSGRQAVCPCTPAPRDLPPQYSTSHAPRLLEIVCPLHTASSHSCLVSVPSANTSLLPQHTFFRRLLPCSATTGGHLLSCIFFLKMHCPKPCRP